METTIPPEQRHRVIDVTIRGAKRSSRRTHYCFIQWGLLFALAGLFSFALMQAGSDLHWVGWPVAGIVGGIMAGMHGAWKGREQGTMTLMDRVHLWLWSCYAATLVMLLVGQLTRGVDPNTFILVLTGMPTLDTGPLMARGILFWVVGGVLFITLKAQGTLVFSRTIIAGYIAPGLMLKQEEDGLRSA